MDECVAALTQQFGLLRNALKGIAEVAKERDANGLLFACHMLMESFSVYETEVVKFIGQLEEDD